ncbi:uncharacterized protein LOC143935049 isoform X1 [Lithobates pipiens]
MAHYIILYAYFYLISMAQVCSQECGEVSVGQNPDVRFIREPKEVNFTCTITSSCNFTSYVKANETTLARIPANGFTQDKNITIIGGGSIFTVIVKNPGRATYYCGAKITFSNRTIKVLGSGTQIRSGCPSFGTKTGIVVSILCVCVGLINKLL